MAQSSGKSKGRPFPKGKSGNPGGRPRGIAHAREYIEAQTAGGTELIDFHLRVMRGEVVVTIAMAGEDGAEVSRPPEIKERQHSADWLADRLWGKAVQAVDHTSGGKPVNFIIDLSEPK